MQTVVDVLPEFGGSRSACVDAHHGSIQLESEPGRTAFTVRLPRWQQAPADALREAQLAAEA